MQEIEVSDQLHPEANLLPENEPSVSTGYGVFGPRKQTGHGGEKKMVKNMHTP
jgi:hypothetical protein